MKKQFSKSQTRRLVEEFFLHIKEKTPREVKKIKRLAMQHQLTLGNKKKTYCASCLAPYIEPSIRINKGKVIVTCEHCGHVARWKFKPDEEIMPLSDDEGIDCAC